MQYAVCSMQYQVQVLLEVPEQSLLAQFFFRFHDFFFFFIEEKLRRFLSPIFFDLSASNFFLQFSLNFSYFLQSYPIYLLL